MSELKPCEAIEILENGDWWCWLSSELDSESEPSTDLHNAIDTAISALRRAQPDNEPLTCEGCEHERHHLDDIGTCGKCRRFVKLKDNYRRPPERGEG